MSRDRVIVLIDPIHPYAVGFLEAAQRRGIRTVCLWTSRKSRSGAHRFPALRSEAVSAHYQVDLDDAGLQRAAAHLHERHDVAAVIPHVEPSVAPCVRLAQLLGLSWAQPLVMSRFRDKHALKQFLVGSPGGPRINRIALVASVHDVRTAMDEHDLDRVVLKPNDGYGNVSIGFFDRRSTDAEIAAHLGYEGESMLLEERLDGVEFFANGQVNAVGGIDVTRVGTYVRTTLNGRPNVEIADRAVRTDEPEFEVIAEYTRHVVATTEVRRTPFHLECIVDDKGPCLVEVAARLVGGEPIDSWLHGVDLVEAALVQYLGEGTSDALQLDWERYDAHVVGEVLGSCEQLGRIARVRGLDRAEASPGFLRWGHRPAVGDRVVPTVDRFGTTWNAVMVAPDLRAWHERAGAVRAAVELDVVGRGDRRPLLRLRAVAPTVPRLLRRVRTLLWTR